MQTKLYLGDSIYADWDGHGIVLTTENGYLDDPRNRIVLEPQVYAVLLEFVRTLEIKLSETGHTFFSR
jgi:hypothetical protein